MNESDIHGRLIALEVRESERHKDIVELHDAVRCLTNEVRELNKWKASIRTPLAAVGVFVLAAISAAGAWAWSFVTKITGAD